MRIGRMAVVPLLLAAATSHVHTQAPAQSAPAGPTFDVVSIKRNMSGTPITPPPVEYPNGGFRLTNVPVNALINRAFPPQPIPTERVGLPAWATTDRYDVNATSTLPRATDEARA